VAITFLVKDSSKKDKKCLIRYIKVNENTKQETFNFLADNKFHLLNFKSIQPDADNNWLHTEENGFKKLMPLFDKNDNGIFKDIFNGVNTARDEWVTDFNEQNLAEKIKYFISVYNENVKDLSKIKDIKELEQKIDKTIKWSESLQNRLQQGKKCKFSLKNIVKIEYRPYIAKKFYGDVICNERLTKNHYKFYGKNLDSTNPTILFATSNWQDFSVCASNKLTFFQYFMDPAKCASLYYFNEKNEPILNITDWCLIQFKENYIDDTISKEEIFYYTYAVLHNPNYREKYKQNLKRQLPAIPFYNEFRKWANWGKVLMYLHIVYEIVEPFKLKVENDGIKTNPKPKLKIVKDKGTIVLDENTTISNLPDAVWEYKLGNRSAIEWVIDQYKETNYSEKVLETYPDKKTLHENFNKYKFADFKDNVIDLLKRLTTVSLQTVEIMNDMKKEN